MDVNKFFCSIGYDGKSSIIDKTAFSKFKNKNISQLLECGAFRQAAAYAIYSDSNEYLQLVADAYNKLSNSNYTKEQIPRLFGVSKVDVKKLLFL